MSPLGLVPPGGINFSLSPLKTDAEMVHLAGRKTADPAVDNSKFVRSLDFVLTLKHVLIDLEYRLLCIFRYLFAHRHR